MMLPTLLLVVAAALAVVYGHLRRQPDRRRLWLAAFRLGLGAGVARAVLASVGWYVVEHDGGPMQVPAFALAMAAWPEAALLPGPRVGTTPPGFYARLALLLVASTTVLVGAVALVVDSRRGTG
jgi:hypothetical protein